MIEQIEAVFKMMELLGLHYVDVPSLGKPWPPDLVKELDIKPSGGVFSIWSRGRRMMYDGQIRNCLSRSNEEVWERRCLNHLRIHPAMIQRVMPLLSGRCRDVLTSRAMESGMPYAKRLLVQFYRLNFLWAVG